MDSLTLEVNRFYERYPYPRLPIRDRKDLLEKLHANVMRRILSTAGITPDALKGRRVLDAGCGTGEKSCYFSACGAHATGIDLCKSSLERARELAEKLGLEVEFKKRDLLEFNEKDVYDHVFSLGVLHHTSNPRMGFENIVGACKKGGTVTVGLYNAYGRFFHRTKRWWIYARCGRVVEKRMGLIREDILHRDFKSAHEEAYASDKYANPYESYHTVGEVLDWFEECSLEFIGAHPEFGRSASVSQLKWLARGWGFFIMSGRKI